MILAIDPGITTGIAFHDTSGYVTTTTKEDVELWSILTGVPWETVVCEAFATSGRISAPGLATVRLIGGVQALCYRLSIPVHMHSPQVRYPYLKQAKIMKRGHIIHEIDALAHLLRWEADHAK